MNKQYIRREIIIQILEFEMASKIKKAKAALEYYAATGDLSLIHI